jgi:hypothetical protein
MDRGGIQYPACWKIVWNGRGGFYPDGAIIERGSNPDITPSAAAIARIHPY